MSAEDDLKRYQRDQERQLFDEVAEMERRWQCGIREKQSADALDQRKLREKQIDKLWPQTYELGRLAGMSDLHAVAWAFNMVRQAKQLMAA
jgi:hypothetical protein